MAAHLLWHATMIAMTFWTDYKDGTTKETDGGGLGITYHSSARVRISDSFISKFVSIIWKISLKTNLQRLPWFTANI